MFLPSLMSYFKLQSCQTVCNFPTMPCYFIYWVYFYFFCRPILLPASTAFLSTWRTSPLSRDKQPFSPWIHSWLYHFSSLPMENAFLLCKPNRPCGGFCYSAWNILQHILFVESHPNVLCIPRNSDNTHKYLSNTLAQVLLFTLHQSLHKLTH